MQVSVVLYKSLVLPFYRQHSGILLTVVFLMFGVVESSQVVNYHVSLISGMLGSGIFLLIVMGIWLLYSLKSLHYFIKISSQDSYRFLDHLAAIHASKSFLAFLFTVVLSFLPILIYSIFIYVIAFKQQMYGEAALIFVYQSFLCCLVALILNHRVRHQHIKPLFTLPQIPWPFRSGLASFSLSYLLKEEKAALFISKLFSIALIYVVRETLEPGDDFRIIGITWIFAVLAHTFIVGKLKDFGDQFLHWTRSLPITTNSRYLVLLKIYSLLLLPELFLVATSIGHGISLIGLLLLFIFATGYLLFIHAYLYKPGRIVDRFATFLFWAFIFSFFLILSKLLWLTALLYFSISFYWFRRWFYRHEPITGS